MRGVVETEKGRESREAEASHDHVEKGGGEESPRGAREKLRVKEVRIRGSKKSKREKRG